MIIGLDEGVSSAIEAWLEGMPAGDGKDRRVAVFDADGTLWRGDVGEAFFRHQVDRKTVPGAPAKDPWKAYLAEAVGGDTAKAYGWLAQWNAGVAEADLIGWCDDFFKETWARHVFEPMRALTHVLLNSGFEVWVVTGSTRWSVQAGVAGFGIAPDRVIGSAVGVRAGHLTGELAYEVPYRAGKARLIEKYIGVPPMFVAGNTYWDQEMMSLVPSSMGLALAVHSEEQGEPNHESEQKLQKLAAEKGWLSQRFGAAP